MKMDRRTFLGSAALLSALSALPGRAALGALTGNAKPQPGSWRTFDVTTRVEVVGAEGAAKAWIPLPNFAADDWMRPMGDRWQVDGGKASKLEVSPYNAALLMVEWPAGTPSPVVEVTSRVATRDRNLDLSRPGPRQTLSAAERALFLAPTQLIPTNGIVKNTAEQITAGAKTELEKAQRIYDWVCANTFRDPKVRGCGNGNVALMLETGDLRGKCADLNGLYVGLARAAGLPARDLYGIRVAPSQLGYKSLGANSETISKAQHCRAEVFLSDFGWVPVDPADVRKFVLEEPPGNLPVSDAKVEAVRDTLFGAWETNWIAFNQAHDVALPGSKEAPLGFLMYPQVQTAAGPRDCLNPDDCKYTITSKEVMAA